MSESVKLAENVLKITDLREMSSKAQYNMRSSFIRDSGSKMPDKKTFLNRQASACLKQEHSGKSTESLPIKQSVFQ